MEIYTLRTKFCKKRMCVLMDEKRNEIVLFENQGVKLEVNLKDETVWLNLEQMAELFKRDKSVISRHIKNALIEELKGEKVVAKFATTTRTWCYSYR